MAENKKEKVIDYDMYNICNFDNHKEMMYKLKLDKGYELYGSPLLIDGDIFQVIILKE